VRACNRLDVQLYAYAETLLDEQIQAQGPGFARDLRRFQAANRLLQPLARVYSQLGQFSVRAWLKDWWNPSSAPQAR
jgi:hypothetical protein